MEEVQFPEEEGCIIYQKSRDDFVFENDLHEGRLIYVEEGVCMCWEGFIFTVAEVSKEGSMGKVPHQVPKYYKRWNLRPATGSRGQRHYRSLSRNNVYMQM